MEKSINKSLLYRNNIITSIKRSRVFLLCLIMVSFVVQAQVNMVVDPSMENYARCPTTSTENEGCYTWHTLDSINNTPNAVGSCTPLYLNTCSSSPGNSLPHNYSQGYSFMLPRTGEGMYVNVFYCDPVNCNPVFNRSYLRGRIRRQLISGQEYCGKFYVSLFKNSRFGVDRIGAYIDNGAIDIFDDCLPILITPNFENPSLSAITDTIGWTKVEGSFIANGNETYITIGNFYSHANTQKIVVKPISSRYVSNYYIDDVSIIPITIQAFAGKDATICVGDSLSLGRTPETGIECQWYKPGNPVPFSNTSNFTFKADSEGAYTFIQRMDNCKITFDTVTVSVESDCNTTLDIPNVFTPNEDGVNDAWRFAIKHTTDVKYSIYNRWGNLMKDSTLTAQTVVSWDGRTTSGEACTAGVYYYVLTYTDAKGEAQHRNGYIILIH